MLRLAGDVPAARTDAAQEVGQAPRMPVSPGRGGAPRSTYASRHASQRAGSSRARDGDTSTAAPGSPRDSAHGATPPIQRARSTCVRAPLPQPGPDDRPAWTVRSLRIRASAVRGSSTASVSLASCAWWRAAISAKPGMESASSSSPVSRLTISIIRRHHPPRSSAGE